MQQYGPQNSHAPVSPPLSFLEQEARRTGRSVEELEALIRGSQRPAPVVPPFLRNNPGPSIGPDHYAEGLERQGFSGGRINRAMRNRHDNTMQYGTAQPGIGQMITANTQKADALHGSQGLLNAPQDALAFAGPYATLTRIAPIVANSRPLQFVNRLPGVSQGQRVARAIDPSFTRGTTSGTMGNITGRIANSTVGAASLGAAHEAFYGDKHKDKRKAASAAKNIGITSGPMSRILPLLTGAL